MLNKIHDFYDSRYTDDSLYFESQKTQIIERNSY